MIERVLIAPNPVTAWESFAPIELPFGEGRGLSFVKCDYENRRLGGFWQASVSVVGDPVLLGQLWQDGLGRDVKFKGTRDFTAFHGYVNGMRWHLPGGGAKYKSLDLMANRIFCRYKDASSSDAFGRSAVADDTASQARYGIKEFVVSAGRSPSASVASGVATRLLPMKAWPKYAREGLKQGGSGGEQKERIDLLLRGYIWTLRWRVYNQTSGGTADSQSADLELATILGSPANPAHMTLMDYKTNMIAWLRLNDKSGSAALNEVGVSGVLGSAGAAPTMGSAGIGDGGTAFSFDGGDYVDIFGAVPPAAFNGAKGSLLIWARITDAAVWADGTIRRIAFLSPDNGNNQINFRKTATANQIGMGRTGGGVVDQVLDTSLAATTDWFMLALTWDTTADELKAYINGVQIGSTQTGLGAFTGALNPTYCCLGANDTGAANPWKGLLAHGTVWANRVLTAAEILDIYSGGDGLTAAVAATGPAQFLAPASTWRLQANPMGALKYYDADQWLLDIALGIVAQGDNLQQPWTFYLTEDRVPVYEPWTPSMDRDL